MRTPPLRVILVGCGAMSRGWIRAIQDNPDLELIGLVDLRLETAMERRDEFGLSVAVDSSLESMLRTLKPDALFDCTIPEAHADNALVAFRHGVHVLGEKPLAHDLSAARAMVEAARASACVHAVMQNRRFDPNIRRVRRFLETGRIGAVTTINADFYIGAHFGGFRDAMSHVLLLDMAIHTFDAARFIGGANPVSVYAVEWNPKGSSYERDASAMCLFEMSDGSVFNYRGSWAAEGFPTTWESDWRIVGERGTVRWDGGDHPKASLVTTPARDEHQNVLRFQAELTELELPPLEAHERVGGHAGGIADFVDALRTGRTPENVSSDNLHSFEMVFGAIESAQSGRRVDIQPR